MYGKWEMCFEHFFSPLMWLWHYRLWIPLIQVDKTITQKHMYICLIKFLLQSHFIIWSFDFSCSLMGFEIRLEAPSCLSFLLKHFHVPLNALGIED